MRYTIKMVLIIIGFIIMIILKKRNKLNQKKLMTYLTIFSFIVMLPIDDLFIRFSSPEAYVRYYYFDTYPKQIMYGKDSCLVNAVESTGKTALIYLRRENNLYKMSYVWPGKLIKKIDLNDNGFIEIMKVRETEDYYIEAYLFFKDGPIKAILDDGTELQLEESGITYFGQMYIEDYKEGRYIYIDGEKILI